jgi:hypothetical protein
VRLAGFLSKAERVLQLAAVRSLQKTVLVSNWLDNLGTVEQE